MKQGKIIGNTLIVFRKREEVRSDQASDNSRRQESHINLGASDIGIDTSSDSSDNSNKPRRPNELRMAIKDIEEERKRRKPSNSPARSIDNTVRQWIDEVNREAAR